MGAWGHGHFEDDAALDFMAEIEYADNVREVLIAAFNTAIHTHDLDADDANAVIVAAAYVDRQTNGTRFSGAGDEPLDVDTFPERHPGQDFAELKEQAVNALQVVLSDQSELNELWAENEEDYPAWRQGIAQLIERLQSS